MRDGSFCMVRRCGSNRDSPIVLVYQAHVVLGTSGCSHFDNTEFAGPASNDPSILIVPLLIILCHDFGNDNEDLDDLNIGLSPFNSILNGLVLQGTGDPPHNPHLYNTTHSGTPGSDTTQIRPAHRPVYQLLRCFLSVVLLYLVVLAPGHF
ncbi:hypothetical protein F5Y10DRAFT_66686 [Nemania abortiva]|nr:hypothetical protein F5Y10DRAFT_66686 [Nemania abortiva]